MTENTLIFTTRVQVIYFSTDDGSLEKEFATSKKRISFEDAEQILNARNIPFNEILKVKYELKDLAIEVEDYKAQIQN